MHTTDNGDGTYTHTLAPGDVTTALFKMHAAYAPWPPEDFSGTVTFGRSGPMGNDPNAQGYQQPSLGVVIGWNRPQARWWQPFIMLDLGFWYMQFGWLYD